MASASRRDKKEELAALRRDLDNTTRLANNCARLSLQTSHRVGMDSAKKSVVCFLSGSAKQDLGEKWSAWRATSSLPPEQRPPQQPLPWRQQVEQWLYQYLAHGMQNSMSPEVEQALQDLKLLERSVDSVSHRDPRKEITPGLLSWSSAPVKFPTAYVVRSSTSSGASIVGRSRPVGIRPCRYRPSAPARRVMDDLGLEPPGKGAGKNRRSPKREAPGENPSPTSGNPSKQR